MKGAIGNAFIMNMVISFILIFYMLLIASMAITKTYKVKNFLVNYVTSFDFEKPNFDSDNFDQRLRHYWVSDYDDDVDTLSKFGYMLARDSECPKKNNDGYSIISNKSEGKYDYCVYIRYHSNDDSRAVARYNYMVLVYLKFDFPIVGEFMKLPITGETKTITVFK